MKPFRKGKWKTSELEWPDGVLVKEACPGSGYLITRDSTEKLLEAAKKVQIRYFWYLVS